MSIDLDQTCHHQKQTTGYNYMQARHAMSVGGTTSPQHMGIMNNAVAGHLMHAHYLHTYCRYARSATAQRSVRNLGTCQDRYSPRANWGEFELCVRLFVCLLASLASCVGAGLGVK